MECPHCQKEIPGKECSYCKARVPLESLYCMACGSPFKEPEAGPVEDEEGAFDLENRILCPDGTCTGIIVNGRCTECGRTLDDGPQGSS
jgi:hypothetical protein